MVIKRVLLSIAFSTQVMFFSGCGFWGEDAPEAEFVELPSSGTSCPEPEKILTGDVDEASTALDCWYNEINSSLDQIQGSNPDTITDSEVRILLNMKILSIGDMPAETAYRKYVEIKRFLGMPEYVNRSSMSHWKTWIKSNQPAIRQSYRLFNRFKTKDYLDSNSIWEALNLLSRLLIEVDWKFTPRQISDGITYITTDLNDTLEGHLEELISLGNESFGSICPNYELEENFSSKKVGVCLSEILNHFGDSKEFMEFFLNPPRRANNLIDIERSLDSTQTLVESWFLKYEPSPIDLGKWLNFIRNFDASLPLDFQRSLRWLRKLNDGSSENEIYAQSIPFFFKMFKRYQEVWIDGLKAFNSSGICSDTLNDLEWKDCDFGYPNEHWKTQSKSLDLASKIVHPELSEEFKKISPTVIMRLAVYSAISAAAIELFDENGDGVVSTSGTESPFESNEVFDLIATAIQTVETIGEIKSNLRGEKNTPRFGLRQFELSGLARLATDVGSGVLLYLDDDEWATRKLIQSNLEALYGEDVLYLDRLSLTSVFYLLDSMADFRVKMLEELNLNGVEHFYSEERGEEVYDRVGTVNNLEHILTKFYPRMGKSCQEYGFERSCQIAFDEILSNPPAGSAFINGSDLDVLTLASMGFESLLDSCDGNRDSLLTWQNRSSSKEDELYCSFVKARQIALRLMDSRIIDEDSDLRDTMNLLIGISLTRNAVKAALVNGSMDGILIVNPGKWVGRSATLGSLVGLLAELLNEERRKQTDR